MDALLDALSRTPDVGGAELRAWDAADRYLLDYAAAEFPDALAGEVAVIDDTHGALTLGAAALGAASVRVHQDPIVSERALAANAEATGVGGWSSHPLASVVTGTTSLVLVRMPRSLARLDAVTRVIARAAGPSVVVLAVGRVKHMTPTQNGVLGAGFARIDVAHARAKSRIVVAREPVAVPLAEPERAVMGGVTVVAVPGVFAGATLDIGTRALLATFDSLPAGSRVVDLACGTGVVAVELARRMPAARVLACDVSAVAAESARLTATANGVSVEARQDDGLSAEPDASADLVVLNPPLHAGAAVTTAIALRLFADAARVLRPGGELRVVWNSHLGYRAALERIVGPTRQLARTPKFTVTASVRR
ncbi:methyltransferase [Homoserinibacter sp. GY 40078]|nr:class I SAM-dependent methyltransferase [Homoserinibacter sp. GY 40078]TXK19979.1 methyltransferase [Homoserinibacter sp. GY 40078]